MKNHFLSVTIAFGLAMALSACGDSADPVEEPAAEAESAEPDAIETRQALLEGIGDAFMAIRGQLEGDADFAVITASADTINANAIDLINHFPEGTSIESGADTEALPTIWEDPEGFAAAHQRLVDASVVMQEAAASGDPAVVGEAIPTLGGACQNCHETYRLDDD